MKNLKKILFILVAAFMVFGVVYAETNNEGEVPYRQKAAVKRQVDGWTTITSDVLGVGDNYLGVGVDCPQANPSGLSRNYCTSFLSIYDDNQNVVKGTDFSVENGNYLVYAVTKTKTGYALLVTKIIEGTETTETTYIVTLDSDLKVVKEKKLVDERIGENDLLSLESYENKVLIYFGKYVMLYDVDTDTVSTILNNVVGAAGITIDKDYIYVASLDLTTLNTVLTKYGHDLKKVSTGTLYTRDTATTGDYGVPLDLEIVNGKFVASLNGRMTKVNGETEPATDNMLVVCDKDFKNLKHYPIDITIHDFVGSRGDIYYIGQKSYSEASNPTASLEDLKIQTPNTRTQAASTIEYYNGKYSLDGEGMWRKKYSDFEAFAVANTLGGVVVGGLKPSVNGGITVKYEYELFNVETVTDGNGQITANKVSGAEGEMVEFTITPNKGYVLKKVTVTNEFGQEIVFTDNKFTLPSADVVITAEFEKEAVTNPVTGINNPYVSLGLIAAMAAGAFIVLKKKKYI